MTLLDSVKTLFLVLIIIAISPMILNIVQRHYNFCIEPRAAVGCITLHGLINQSENCIQQLHDFFEDPDIKAILLKIDCHGAAAGSGDSLFHEITLLKNEFRKPIISLVENVCTSGGYHIACATDHIIAPGMALIGLIGISFPQLFQFEACIKQHTIGHTAIRAGTYQSTVNPLEELSNDEKTGLQQVLDDAYGQFVRHVATSRRLSLEDASTWADATLFTGQQAFSIGLIDEIGSLSNAIKAIKDKALIEGTINWIYPTKKRTLWNLLACSPMIRSLFAIDSNIQHDQTE